MEINLFNQVIRDKCIESGDKSAWPDSTNGIQIYNGVDNIDDRKWSRVKQI